MKSFCVTFEQLVQVHINEKCAAIAIFEPVFSIQGHNMLGNGELRFLPNQFPEFFKSKSLIHCRKKLNHQKPKTVLGGNLMKIVIQESACNENQVRPLLFKSQQKEEKNPKILHFSEHNIKLHSCCIVLQITTLALHFPMMSTEDSFQQKFQQNTFPIYGQLLL